MNVKASTGVVATPEATEKNRVETDVVATYVEKWRNCHISPSGSPWLQTQGERACQHLTSTANTASTGLAKLGQGRRYEKLGCSDH